MKKIWCTLVSLALCACLAIGTCTSAADLTPSDIYNNTTFTEGMRTGSLGESIIADAAYELLKKGVEETAGIIDSVFINPTIVPNLADEKVDRVRIPETTYVIGKHLIKWVEYNESTMSSEERSILAEVELIACPDLMKDSVVYVKSPNDPNFRYPLNYLIFTIYRPSGVVNKYAVKRYRQDRDMYVNRFSMSDNNDYIELPYAGWADEIYRLDETGLGELVPNFSWDREQRIYWNSTNDISSYVGNAIGDKVPVKIESRSVDGYPSDLSIITNNILFTVHGGSGYVNSQHWDWYCGNVTTNKSDNSFNMLTAPQQQNYYYNDKYVANTVIDSSNVNNYYDGAFTPVIGLPTADIDVNTLVPTLTANLKPTLDLAIDDLLGKLFDFYGNMPDIGLTWDSGTNNDYYQIIPDNNTPPTTGINVNVTVDITRPFVNAPDTSPNVSIYVPTVTTTALTPAFIQAGADFVSLGKDMTDMIGITSTIVWLGVAGVGIMLIFKDW